MDLLRRRGASAEAAVIRLCESPPAPLPLLEEVAHRIRTAVPYAGAGWLLTDPATMLHTGAFIEDVPAELHLRLIENELGAQDVAKFSEVARLPTPVARLSHATAGVLERSARYSAIYQPAGYGDELRVAFRTRGGACLAVACLARGDGEPAFSTAEAAFMGRVARHVAHGLRAGLVAAGREHGTAGPPGVLVLDGNDAVESVTDAAARWLGALPRNGLELPSIIYELARAARAGSPGATQARVQLPSGRWLLLHAAALRHPLAPPDRTAIVVEPAPAADLVPLIAALHELTDREQQIARLMASGLAVEAIADRLFLSPHTVRDHVKALFEKLDVRSRPELTAKLLHEHVAPDNR